MVENGSLVVSVIDCVLLYVPPLVGIAVTVGGVVSSAVVVLVVIFVTVDTLLFA
jgi:hypothetical protein